MPRRIALILASALLLATAAPAAAGKPTVERVELADIGVRDDFLSDFCGFDIWGDFTGHITFRLFTDADGNPTREVNNFGIRVRYYSDTAEVSSGDVGPDRVWYLDDGSIIVKVTGNIRPITLPGQGRVYADAGVTTFHVTFDENGEASFELLAQAGNHSDVTLEEVLCEALGG